MNKAAARFAIYAAPAPGSALADFGARLLGYDAAEAREVEQLVPQNLDAQAWRELTADPRRYGFHGTLKAPFRLADGHTPQDLESFAAQFARSRPPVRVGLMLQQIGGFFALVPAGRPPALHGLADDVVRAFDPFRAGLSAADREKRLRAGLSARQIELLDAWGYPYVLDGFRFHMTLTGRIPAEQQAAARLGLAPMVDAALGPAPVAFTLGELCIFEQPAPDARFYIRARFPLLRPED